MSIVELDRFLDLRNSDPVLDKSLGEPMDLAGFLELAREHGFILSESDVFEAQQREVLSRSSKSLQRDQAQESRRLRNFIHG